ncbi:energy-dependent translational throttle protein EttA [Candidatus Chloroploca sp. M-50]|uniref:Energy-dependent translational throttle protein EttA n=1 Tax=Candidatus Chloroploca mongolica TaxID=2528176 RepID=A0ABS4DCL5_9CHLR|nr:energy-dependent translational throttle protein EttA [Candidatus Chloroploca mongolica]MBP1467195.1 energy-dependent translational throttle protein EttA [Candidatus Chloroploca mongolica]
MVLEVEGAVVSDTKIIYSMIRVSKLHPPNKEVLKNISLSYFYGAKIGVIGANGSGKSSLLRILAGVDKDFNGETVLAPGYTIGLLEQEPQLDGTLTVRDIVEQGMAETVALMRRYDEIAEQFADPEADFDALIAEQGELQEKIDHVDGWNLESKLELAMDALRCPPADTPIRVLSGGEQRRVALCRLLLQTPDILLLDEPTNHLDAESVAWLERHLQEYKGTVIAVTHDRHFLNNVAGWILELERGHGIPWRGNYSSWLEQKQQQVAANEKQASQRQKSLQRELDWINMAPKGRHAKSKARISAYERLLSENQEQQDRELEIFVPAGPRLGDVVIKAEGLAKGYGDRLLYDNLSFDLPPGGIVGIIGPNGAGKTTLFRMVVGNEQPDSGTLTIGSTVTLGYVDQSRDTLNPDKTVWEEISEGNDLIVLGNRQINSRAYCARFNFTGSDQQKLVGTLSGGERNRVHLAKVLKSGANVLLLDEPTNDLDVHTLRALEEGLENFAGCAVIISHDRWFLDRIATHILAFENDSQAFWFPGSYSEYEADYHRRKGSAADQPHRVIYKKLVR